MQAVILAGGLGSRLGKETSSIPKPMVEIGGKPILWHIMKTYDLYGINNFIIACGYKSKVIKDFFINYSNTFTNLRVKFSSNQIEQLQEIKEKWTITLIESGLSTSTGGRLLKISDYLEEETFCMTYGDGLAAINISKLLESHQKSKKLVTVTAVPSPPRFGDLEITNGNVQKFNEKTQDSNKRINGGYFVLNKAALNYIQSETEMWEEEPIRRLISESQLNAFSFDGFWHPMDTIRDKNYLENLVSQRSAPWMKWK